MSQPEAPAGARGGTYRLLSRLALSEVDAELAEQLNDLPIFGEALAESGGVARLQRLRSDYAQLFLFNVHPYESVYLDGTGMLNAACSGAVQEYFQARGFESVWLARVGAPDHLGLELELLAELADAEDATQAAGQAGQAQALRAEQRAFLESHLLRWAPIVGRLVAEQAGTPFYRCYGEALELFVLGEFEALSGRLSA